MSGPLLVSHLLSVSLGPQLCRGNRNDSPIFHAFFAIWHFLSVQGATAVNHLKQREVSFEMQLSDVACW